MRESVDIVNGKAAAAGEDLLELVHGVMHQVRGQMREALRGGPELTGMEVRVLRFFHRHPGATQADLAAHSGRDKAQLARLVKGLRERGLLEAQADAADRRNLRITPSAEGMRVERALAQVHRRLGSQAAAGLSAAERAQLASLLARLKENLAAGS